MSKQFITKEFQQFMTVDHSREEALHQPLYDWQEYPAAGVLELAFFGTAYNGRTNKLSDTNLEDSQKMGGTKRMGVKAITIIVAPGKPPVQDTADLTLASALNDLQTILFSKSHLILKIGDKPYLIESPIGAIPGGAGVAAFAGGIQRTQGAPANGTLQVSGGANGMPVYSNRYELSVPIPLESVTNLECTMKWAALGAVSAAAQIQLKLHGMQIRNRG